MKEKPVFGTSKCAQVGILVHNMEKSVQAYAAFLGVDVPAICQTGEYEEAINVIELIKGVCAGTPFCIIMTCRWS